MHVVELGFHCNNACAFCGQGKLREMQPPEAVDALFARVDAAPPHDTLAFVGGEPTLVEELCDLVERARARGVTRIVVQTNARRLAVDGVASALTAAGVTSLDVSLHGDSEALHDYHTGTEGSFRQTALGIRRARAARLELGVSVVVTRSNYRHLSGIVRVAHTLGGRAVRFVLARPLGAALENAARIVPEPRMVWPHLARAFELSRTLGLAFAAPDFELSSGQDVDQWFAGLGTTEPAATHANTPGQLNPPGAVAAGSPTHSLHQSSQGPGW